MSTDTSVDCRSICRPICRSRGAQNTHDPLYLSAPNRKQNPPFNKLKAKIHLAASGSLVWPVSLFNERAFVL